ncbi:glycosyltransferase family 2 protein [Apilactobacillus kunkeei]|nr:glycosyltransferase family 2 protein [Apilactobacillus kunkeei]
MNEPYLSVIVACYNVQDYIEKCLSSIANTNFPMESLEVLMIDDGSTDNTSKIIDEFANKYDSFRALHKENGGLSNTRNYGMKHARGSTSPLLMVMILSQLTLIHQWRLKHVKMIQT